MLLVILILNILTFILLLMWVSAMINQVAIIRADIDFMLKITRYKLAKKLITWGIKLEDIPSNPEEFDKFLAKAYFE